MKDIREVISNSNGKQVVLINRKSDPIMWIVNVYKKILFFKKEIKSYWFNDKDEARKFALTLASQT
jgi:hypothetical protein